jgi:sporadic carbohydrate cluster protein (TIGR04323 family)
MKTLTTYTLPRPFNGYNIPIAIQSVYLREYSKSNSMQFSLPVTEIHYDNCYNMLIELINSQKTTDIGIVSLFILPFEKPHILNKIFKSSHCKKIHYHFLLESKILNYRDLILSIKEISTIRKYSRVI